MLTNNLWKKYIKYVKVCYRTFSRRLAHLRAEYCLQKWHNLIKIQSTRVYWRHLESYYSSANNRYEEYLLRVILPLLQQITEVGHFWHGDINPRTCFQSKNRNLALFCSWWKITARSWLHYYSISGSSTSCELGLTWSEYICDLVAWNVAVIISDACNDVISDEDPLATYNNSDTKITCGNNSV